MELYIKAGPDGTSVGDCPFAHFVRAVLSMKGLECTVSSDCVFFLLNIFAKKLFLFFLTVIMIFFIVSTKNMLFDTG